MEMAYDLVVLACWCCHQLLYSLVGVGRNLAAATNCCTHYHWGQTGDRQGTDRGQTGDRQRTNRGQTGDQRHARALPELKSAASVYCSPCHLPAYVTYFLGPNLLQIGKLAIYADCYATSIQHH
jgi:hypothetical protein